MLLRPGVTIVCLASIGLGAFGLVVPAFGQDKLPVPSEAAQARAMALVREVYGREWDDARTVPEKQGLALKLLEIAAESPDDVNRYVLLKVAGDVAAQAGDAVLAFRAVEAMAERYDVDGYQLKGATLSQAAGSATSQKDHQSVADLAVDLIEQAVARDDFAAAKYLGELAAASARRARLYALAREIAARNGEVEEIAEAYQNVQAAAATLEKDPIDPAANLTVGRYHCLFKGDWNGGLPMLALGSDEKLKQLAAKELQGAAGTDAQMALGDGWWQLASAHEGAAKKQLEARAAYWYQKVLPVLSGLQREKVEKRLETARPTPGATAEVEAVRVGPPTLVRLDEINSPGMDVYPWLSSDGLTIYWTREGGSRPSTIWSATRRSPDARFSRAAPLLEGRQATLTDDGLNAVLLVDSKLHTASRPDVTRPFSKPQLIAEFSGQPRPKSPAFVDDGLTLVFQRSGPGGRGWEFVVSARPTLRSPWSKPAHVAVVVPNDRNPTLTWPFMTPDRKGMFFCLGLDKVPFVVTARRQVTTSPFNRLDTVDVRGAPLRGRCPRYVEATRELYFCIPPSAESDDWDLWVVKNYRPPW